MGESALRTGKRLFSAMERLAGRRLGKHLETEAYYEELIKLSPRLSLLLQEQDRAEITFLETGNHILGFEELYDEYVGQQYELMQKRIEESFQNGMATCFFGRMTIQQSPPEEELEREAEAARKRLAEAAEGAEEKLARVTSAMDRWGEALARCAFAEGYALVLQLFKRFAPEFIEDETLTGRVTRMLAKLGENPDSAGRQIREE